MLQDYEYTSDATFEDVSTYFNVPLSDLYKINNIPNPFPRPDDVISKTESFTGLDGFIKVPILQNGNESVENDGYDAVSELKFNAMNTRGVGLSGWVLGSAAQYKCWIQIENTVYYFPCYTENFTDTHTAHFTQQNPMGRSEPFQIYQNSGPRTVSVSFTMHVEMTHVTPIPELVAAVQSAEYPLGTGRSDTITPRVILKIGDSCYIKGIIADSVTADWSGPLIDNKYVMVTLSFTVTECTGTPKTAAMVKSGWS